MAYSCCCYIVDAGYMFPTLLSATQIKAAIASAAVDVKIVCVGDPPPDAGPFVDICREHDIDLLFVPSRAIDDMPIMFGRFFLARFLEPHYEAIVYLDGDTQISGSLEPLLGVRLEPGRFLAVRDPMTFMIENSVREWRKRRDYFRAIGISDQNVTRYFNSGVLRFNLRDWSHIGKAALKVSADHGHGLRFPDQDALNILFGSDYIGMSYRWNFPAFLMSCGYDELVSPRVYHFMSNPRPWHGPFAPWGSSWHAPYQALTASYPRLRHLLKPAGRLTAARYALQQGFKARVERPAWMKSQVREALLRLEAEAYV